MLRSILFFSIAIKALLSVGFAQWEPSGILRSIPVQENCRATGGDIAVALNIGSPVIYFCQATANALNNQHPGAGHFYYVHEFGHHALATSDERRVDCWAARELADAPNGDFYISAMLDHLQSRGGEYHPRYGTMIERAERIEHCAYGGSRIQTREEVGRSCCMTQGGKCGPFYNQSPLPVGSPCSCSYGNPMANGQVCR